MRQETLIDSQSPHTAINWRELWRYRDLLLVLVHRDVAVRYRQTALGVLWAVVQPLGMMAIFTVIFGRWARFETGEVPYHLFALAGLIPWLFFANSLTAAGNSVLNSQGLISKVYFPRLIIPIAAVGAPLMDFFVSSLLMLLFLLYYGVPVGLNILLVPCVALIAVLAAIGVGSFITALSVSYRDFRHLLPFLVTAWMFLTPVIYPATMVPESWRWIVDLNPMAGVVDGMRSAVLGSPLEIHRLAQSALIALILFWLGTRHFRRLERKFADDI